MHDQIKRTAASYILQCGRDVLRDNLGQIEAAGKRVDTKRKID